MLLNNYSVLNSSPGRAIGNFTNLYSNYKPGGQYSFYDPDTDITRVVNKASFPTGTEPPYSWILAPGGGEFSSTTLLRGSGTLSPTMYISKDLSTTDLAGMGSLSGSLSLLSQLATSMDGVATLSASMSLGLSLGTTLSGTGGLTSALSLLVGMISSLSGSGAITANLTGIARLEASIFVNSGTATVNELVAGVWAATASSFNEAGTMGEKMNDAGAAGNPWAADPATNNDPDTMGELIQRTEKKVDDNQALILAK